jgi:hypothetical protein
MSEYQSKGNTKNSKPKTSKYVDLLEEDKPIAGQKFVCMSFVSPENILKKKEMYFFEEFLNKYNFNKSMEKFVSFLNFLSYKYKLKFDDVYSDFTEFVQEEKGELSKLNITDDYKTFVDKNEEDLEAKFNVAHNFQTSTRGVKVRGIFPTLEEAELRCKLLREQDPSHDVFVGPVGMWMPWDPEAYKTGRVEYLEEELNKLMSEKIKNETNAKSTFDERIKDAKKSAIEDNIKKAEKSGSKLTQTIDENGNLIGINNMNTQIEVLQQNTTLTSEDIRNELFEGENIIMGKSDYGQSLLTSGPFASKK